MKMTTTMSKSKKENENPNTTNRKPLAKTALLTGISQFAPKDELSERSLLPRCSENPQDSHRLLKEAQQNSARIIK
jgi:hypothetical protein